jgi:hypothetical protein
LVNTRSARTSPAALGRSPARRRFSWSTLKANVVTQRFAGWSFVGGRSHLFQASRCCAERPPADVEVEVAPHEAQSLTYPKAGGAKEQPERVKLLTLGRVDERNQFIEGQGR